MFYNSRCTSILILILCVSLTFIFSTLFHLKQSRSAQDLSPERQNKKFNKVTLTGSFIAIEANFQEDCRFIMRGSLFSEHLNKVYTYRKIVIYKTDFINHTDFYANKQ